MKHPLERFRYCPICGSSEFLENSEKSKKCRKCGFEFFMNPSAATAAFIVDEQGRVLVVRRSKDPAKGTFDLPGGFCDIGETSEEGVMREVKEETGLTVTSVKFLFSLPNTYLYSGLNIPTIDSFYLCTVENAACAEAHDDAADVVWVPINELEPELFGLQSISKGVAKWLSEYV